MCACSDTLRNEFVQVAERGGRKRMSFEICLSFCADSGGAERHTYSFQFPDPADLRFPSLTVRESDKSLRHKLPDWASLRRRPTVRRLQS